MAKKVRFNHAYDKDKYVPSLLQKFAEKQITVDELSKIFIEDIKWDYRTNPKSDHVGPNSWQAVYDAYLQGIMTAEEYLKIVVAFEEDLNNKEAALYESRPRNTKRPN